MIFFIVYKVITLNIQGKYTNYTRGVQAYISYRIRIFIHSKLVSKVLYL